MTTLIIHPQDPSTDFLKAIYKDIPNPTVITKGDYTRQDINDLIDSHDRVIMLGHGTTRGLLSVGMFDNLPAYVINGNNADSLSLKKDNVYVWCYASDFVDQYKLQGFSTSMFISELREALYCGIDYTTHEEVDSQNDFFCNLLSKVVDQPSKNIYTFINEEFGELAHYNKIADYNWKGLRLF